MSGINERGARQCRTTATQLLLEKHPCTGKLFLEVVQELLHHSGRGQKMSSVFKKFWQINLKREKVWLRHKPEKSRFQRTVSEYSVL